MVKKWLTWINLALVGAIGLLLLSALYYMWASPTDFTMPETTARKSNIPKGSFVRPQEEYQNLGAPALQLNFSPLSVQLPDLRRYLIYYGKNSRPDANEANPVLYFAFTGNKTPVGVSPGERLYVMYDKKMTPPQYVFSVGNAQAPLWIEASLQGNQALVKVGMKSDSGQEIRDPAAYAEFSLPEKEYVRFSGATWELGKWRVDGTLLARQKARWYGVDKFIEDHGGEEYKDWDHKQRIDFGEGDEAYSVYVNQSDCLIWADNRWKNVKPGEASLKSPLMCIKKVDERIMNLELWDVDGKGKIILNLVKANEAWMPQNLEQSFKFVGARTRSQFVFEIDHERILLSPHDWLLLTDGIWKKLQTPEDIDAYVDRKTVGPLFVFNTLERKDDRQVIIGSLYNAARTEKVVIELPLQQGNPPPGMQAGKKSPDDKRQKSKETNGSPVLNTGARPNPSGQHPVGPNGPVPAGRPPVYLEDDDDDDDEDYDD